MTPDPIAGSIVNPQSLNRYTYVLNNPLRFTDPLGLDPECALMIGPLPEGVDEKDRPIICYDTITVTADPAFCELSPSLCAARLALNVTLRGAEVDPAKLEGLKDRLEWWKEFSQSLFGKFGMIRRSGESFTACWNRVTSDIYGSVGLPPDREIMAFAAGAVGIGSSIKWWRFAGAWQRPSSIMARRGVQLLYGHGHHGVAKGARLLGKGLAVVGAAAVGIRIGAAIDCAQETPR